ncbi:pyridoxal 5'-phosphate synthase, putative [Plasmodium gaboni]|uniref:NAD(P)H-hydrate epimerase n=1 Tax=Plasmodium gaboni TaxID=647221 RepID=A0ABY1UUI8_9APIC|nr:pyridoxal 5'-phosphate synthase, putative [Plasmodium gaboni]
MNKNLFIKSLTFSRSLKNFYVLSLLNYLKLKIYNKIYVPTLGVSLKRKRSSYILNMRKMEITYLSQDLSQKIDNELMSDEIGYTTEQLMELAGLSISQIIFKEYKPNEFKKILICCGPGNNGGDGLVAARHLKQFGYDIMILYPKVNDKTLFKRLLKLLEHYEINVLRSITPSDLDNYDLIIDSIFGFSFKGEPRKPFDEIIQMINNSNKVVVSVDVPSGINIDSGLSTNSLFINSDMNISLMLPKQGLINYKKKHYLGGRFIPLSIIKKYNLKVPSFSDDNPYVML